MKKSFSYMFLMLAAVFISGNALAEEFTKKFNKSWPAGEVETLSIENKFGEVKVNSTSGTLVTVDVLVKAEGPESKAKKILDAIKVDFGKEGSTALAETDFDDNTRMSGKFSVDYIVNLPSGKNLTVSNKYGNLIIGELKGKASLDVAYGNITATRLVGPSNEIELAYGSGDIESLSNANIEMGYFKLTIGTGTDLSLESKYSHLNADKLNDLSIESKYDNVNIGSLVSLDGESKFTTYKIGTLSRKLSIESGYGSVKVEQVSAGFELLEVNSSYATVQLGIESGAAYQVKADCEYCGIEYPEDKFKGNRMKEGTKMSIDGQVGGSGQGRVIVSSKYGNIRLSK